MEIDCCPSCKNLIKLGNQLKWNESRQDYEAGNRFSPMPWPD